MASKPMWEASSASQRSVRTFASSDDPAIATPHLRPAMFQPFEADVNAMARYVISWSSESKGTCSAPGSTSGA